MAQTIDFNSGKEDIGDKSLNRWWFSEPGSVARDLTDYCAQLEIASRPRRFKNFAYHIIATGRAPISYGLAMPDGTSQANGFTYAGDLFNAEYTPPSVNYCSLANDIFANRVWAERPFLEWLPVADDDTDLRLACQQATSYTDALFNDIRTWDVMAAIGKDSGIVGTGWFRVGDSGPHKLDVTRIDDDCVLLDPSAGEEPRNFQLRLFLDRHWLIQQFAKGKDADKIEAALKNAPGCRLGFFQLPVGYLDTLAVIEAWYCSRNDEPGRHVICCNDVVLLDEPYEDEEPPIGSLKYEPIAGSARGRGHVEIQLPIQREYDRITDNLAQQERVMAWGRAQSKNGNGVEETDIVGNSLIVYNLEPVKFDPGIAPPQQLYNRLKELGADLLLCVGLSQQQAQGTATPGVTAAVAMQSEMQISDVRHKALFLRLEGAVEALGKKIIAKAKVTQPVVYSRGRKIDFTSVERALKNGFLRAYPISGLPQSIPARKQEITDRYKNGQITKTQYQRLLGMPVTDFEGDEETASIDLIYAQLDKMENTGKFEAPLPVSDLVSAKDIAIKRYSIRQRQSLQEGSRVKKRTLQLLAQYIELVQERIDEMTPTQQAQATPPPPAPAPDAGQPSDGAAGQSSATIAQ